MEGRIGRRRIFLKVNGGGMIVLVSIVVGQ